MWQILEKKTLVKSIKKLPKEIIKHYEVWKRIVELNGPEGLRAIRGFKDEALKGGLKGMRSSRLSKQWRVLYSVEKDELSVYVIEVTPHDYRRK